MSKHIKSPSPGRPKITIISDGTGPGTKVFSADGQDLSQILPIVGIEIEIDPVEGPIARIVVAQPVLKLKTDNIILHPNLFKEM